MLQYDDFLCFEMRMKTTNGLYGSSLKNIVFLLTCVWRLSTSRHNRLPLPLKQTYIIMYLYFIFICSSWARESGGDKDWTQQWRLDHRQWLPGPEFLRPTNRVRCRPPGTDSDHRESVDVYAGSLLQVPQLQAFCQCWTYVNPHPPKKKHQ